MGRRVNMTMVMLSLAGGIIGFFVGEVILSSLLYTLPDSLFMGLYFGQLALFIGLGCLVAEIISTKINSMSWRRMYVGFSWKFLIPCTLVILFLLGTIMQFLYSLSPGGAKKINDVVMLIDSSGSMGSTDPQNKRFEAAGNLMEQMDADKRVSVFVFNDTINSVQAMAAVTDGVRNEIIDKFESYSQPGGGTNIKGALENAIEHIRQNALPGRNAMVILLSDGGDNFDLRSEFDSTLKPYKDEDVPIFTVAMKGSDVFMLRRISGNSGGKYYSVDDVKDLGFVFNRIYREKDLRLLVGERGSNKYGLLYGFLRVLFFIIIGGVIGFGVGLVFDNKYIARGLSFGGIFSGLAAGIILEAGFLAVPWFGFVLRFLADAALSSIFTLFAGSTLKAEESSIYKRDAESAMPGVRNRGETRSF